MTNDLEVWLRQGLTARGTPYLRYDECTALLGFALVRRCAPTTLEAYEIKGDNEICAPHYGLRIVDNDEFDAQVPFEEQLIASHESMMSCLSEAPEEVRNRILYQIWFVDR